jgi:hypothetical protein
MEFLEILHGAYGRSDAIIAVLDRMSAAGTLQEMRASACEARGLVVAACEWASAVDCQDHWNSLNAVYESLGRVLDRKPDAWLAARRRLAPFDVRLTFMDQHHLDEATISMADLIQTIHALRKPMVPKMREIAYRLAVAAQEARRKEKSAIQENNE